MEGYWAASPESQISVRQFSHESRQEFGPSVQSDDSHWRNVIHDMEQMASATRLDDALQAQF